MIQIIRKQLRKFSFLRNFIAHKLVPLGFMDGYFKSYKLSEVWEERLKDTITCSDNRFIQRAGNAGNIIRGKQIMHNGLKINLGSYYGPEVAKILFENKGVHEPQEERVFTEILKEMPDGATMIELGSFWSFYSMWFNQSVNNANNFMIEPSAFNMQAGIGNFKLNNMKGNFTNAFIGKKSSNQDPTPTVCIDDFVNDKKISYINILHSDIQGFEHDMLLGAEKIIDEKKVGFIFVSTHSNEVHYKCLDFLKGKQFFIISNCDKDNTYSEDGLIVAHAPHINFNKVIAVAQKNEAVALNA